MRLRLKAGVPVAVGQAAVQRLLSQQAPDLRSASLGRSRAWASELHSLSVDLELGACSPSRWQIYHSGHGNGFIQSGGVKGLN